MVLSLFLVEGDEGVGDVLAGGGVALALIELADVGFYAGGVADGEEELIVGEGDEDFAAFGGSDVFLFQNPETYIQGEDGVADPGQFLFWVGIHGVVPY